MSTKAAIATVLWVLDRNPAEWLTVAQVARWTTLPMAAVRQHMADLAEAKTAQVRRDAAGLIYAAAAAYRLPAGEPPPPPAADLFQKRPQEPLKAAKPPTHYPSDWINLDAPYRASLPHPAFVPTVS